MSHLAKIIYKEWFRSFISILVILLLLASIGDIINGFLQGIESSKIFLSYLFKLPGFVSKILPISCMLATLFSFTNLKENSTLIAMLACSFSPKNLIQIIIKSSSFVFLLQIINLSFLEPMANRRERIEDEKSSKFESKYLARSKMGSSRIMWYKTEDYFASFEVFDKKKKLLKNFSIYYFTDDKNEKILKSKLAYYDKNNKWDLKDVVIYSKLNELEFPQTTHHDFYTIKIGETPKDFSQFNSDLTTLNILQLTDFVSSLQKTDIQTNEYEIMLWEKIAVSFSCFVFALIPFGVVYNPNRRSQSFGKNILFSLVFTIGYWFLSTTFTNLGQNGKIPAPIGAMFVPILFLLYTAINFYKNRKL